MLRLSLLNKVTKKWTQFRGKLLFLFTHPDTQSFYQQYFSHIVAVSFIGGGNRNSLTNFIT
jgi:hypothetical protein